MLTTFSAVSKTKQESIKQLFSLMKVESTLDNLIPMLGMGNDKISKFSNSTFWDSLKPTFNKILNEDMAELYDKYYSKKEIKDMVRYYKTKTGQKTITTSPELQRELMTIIWTKYLGDFMKAGGLNLDDIKK